MGTIFVKQSTAVDIAIGPFVDATDGVTAETGLTLSQADIRLKKNNGAWAQKNDNTAATHEENGWYECELDSTDTNTLGIMKLAVHESGAMPVWHTIMVMAANQFDSLFGTDKLQVHLDEVTAGIIAAASFATGAIDAAALAADAASEVATSVWANGARTLTSLDEDSVTLDLDATIRAAIGMSSANLDTQLGDLPTNSELTAALAGITAPTADQNATALLAKVLDESYASNGAAPTVAQLLMALHQREFNFLISGTSIIVYELDGTTEAFRLTLNSASTPTGAQRE